MSQPNRIPPHTESSPGGASGSWTNSPITSISSINSNSMAARDTGYDTITNTTSSCTQLQQHHVTPSSSVSGASPAARNYLSPAQTTPKTTASLQSTIGINTLGSSSSSPAVFSNPQTNGRNPPMNGSFSAPITRTAKGFKFAPPKLGSQRVLPPPNLTNQPANPTPSTNAFTFSSWQTTPIVGGTSSVTITTGATTFSTGSSRTGGLNLGPSLGSISRGTSSRGTTAGPITLGTTPGTIPMNTQTENITSVTATRPPPHTVLAAVTSPPSLPTLTPVLNNMSLNCTTSSRPGPSSTNIGRSVISETDLQSLRALSNAIGQLHTDMSGCRRIQRGSPGAGSLSGSMTPSRDRLNQLKPEIQAIIAAHQQSTAMVKFSTLFNEFDNVLNEVVNERGYDDGYTDRVRYLERINYTCGRLKGLIEAILEGMWTEEGGGNEPIARTLTFNEAEAELPVGDELEALLSKESCYHHGEINIDLNLSSTLCSNLLQFMETDTNTDVTFRIGSQTICAHRIVLAAQSEYFRSLLLGSMRESEPNCVIDLQDVSMATVQLLIRFAYCGCVQLKSVSLQGILNLLEAADRFSFIKLKDALISQLSSLINSNTVIQLLESAFNLNITGLQETCFKVADDNADQLVESDDLLTLPAEILAMILSRDTFIVKETKIYDVIRRWMSANGQSLSQCPVGLVSCIRLALMPQESLVDLSESDETDMFTDKEILRAIKAQTKLCWERMNPRGVKASNNLFADSKYAKVINTVMWSSPTNTVTGTQLATALTLHGAATNNIQFHGRPDTRLCSAVISSQSTRTTNSGMLGLVQGLVTQQKLSVDIQFDHTYLINYIKFEPYPNDPSGDKHGFSYAIEVSLNKTDWKPLLDFSKYTCYGKQQLCLPVIAVKCLRFNLCSLKDSSVPFKLTFTECSFRGQVKSLPYIIKDSIIALPGYYLKCQFAEEWYLTEHGDYACTVTLRMPTFAKHLRLKLKGSCPTNAVGDIRIMINEVESTSKTIQTVLLNSPDESSGIIDLPLPVDTVVCTINLRIINVVQIGIAMTTPPSPASSGGTTYNISLLQLKSE